MVSVGRIVGLLVLAPFILGAGPADKSESTDSFDALMRKAIEPILKAAPEALKNPGPLTPPPAAPAAPVYGGTVERITDPVAVKLRPMSERVLVTVLSATADKPRQVLRDLVTVERKGTDLVYIRRGMADGGHAPDGGSVRAVTDDYGRLKDVTVEAPAAHAALSGTMGLLANLAAQMAVLAARIAVATEIPTYAERGVRSGDVVNDAQGQEAFVRFRRRMVVRGLSTFEGKRVLVVDRTLTVSSQGTGTAAQGYGLIDLNTGFLIYSDDTQAKVDKAGQVEQSRVIRRMPDPGSVAPAAAVR